MAMEPERRDSVSSSTSFVSTCDQQTPARQYSHGAHGTTARVSLHALMERCAEAEHARDLERMQHEKLALQLRHVEAALAQSQQAMGVLETRFQTRTKGYENSVRRAHQAKSELQVRNQDIQALRAENKDLEDAARELLRRRKESTERQETRRASVDDAERTQRETDSMRIAELERVVQTLSTKNDKLISANADLVEQAKREAAVQAALDLTVARKPEHSKAEPETADAKTDHEELYEKRVQEEKKKHDEEKEKHDEEKYQVAAKFTQKDAEHGIQFTEEEDGTVQIFAIKPASAAEKQGLTTGLALVRIADKDTKGMSKAGLRYYLKQRPVHMVFARAASRTVATLTTELQPETEVLRKA